MKLRLNSTNERVKEIVMDSTDYSFTTTSTSIDGGTAAAFFWRLGNYVAHQYGRLGAVGCQFMEIVY